MYDFNAFVEDKNYLWKNMNDRLDIKMKNMPRHYSNKSKSGAYKVSARWHYIKPMMSRHKTIINLVAGLGYWHKDMHDKLDGAISTISACYQTTERSKDPSSFPRESNDLVDLTWALKDLHNARTPWEKFTVKRAFNHGDCSLKYTDRRVLLNRIPQSIRTMKAWDSVKIWPNGNSPRGIGTIRKISMTRDAAPETAFLMQNHPINAEFIQSYKYRTFSNRRLSWFHSGLACEYVQLIPINHNEEMSGNGIPKLLADIDKNQATLYTKMSKVNDVKILDGWVKAMKDLHPVNVGTGLAESVEKFIKDGYRMGLPGLRARDERLSAIDYETMSVLEMINASVNNHRIGAEHNRLALLKYDVNVPDRDMPTLALPEHLETIRIKTSNEMRLAGSDCAHCIGSYYNDNSHMFFRKGNVCAMVSMTSGNIVQCFDRNNKNTPASKKFQSYLTAEIKKADIPFLRTIKKKVIPAEYFNNEVRYDYPF
jgi:hypothetical protein